MSLHTRPLNSEVAHEHTSASSAAARHAASQPGRAAAPDRCGRTADRARCAECRRLAHLHQRKHSCCAERYASVTVVAPRATTADALSTALAVSPPAAARHLLRQCEATALYVASDHSRQWLGG